ncbi:PQQ-dependent sugar dehydrogenase [Chryseobacterium sp. EO14]|uniref:PQQ-dependent sugar dehydrogenase n=1 Tax=Chryseobacterium sp. EO14 TaxID=2950551 RepID=UPI00351E3F2F
MKIRTYHVLVAASRVMASCSDTIDENGGNNGPSLPPVESNAANTNYQPAFAGQTRANGAKTSTPYVSEVVTSALASPWGITALPDGRLLITEKAGTMRIVSSTGTLSNAITGLPSVNSGGQGGLLGLCVDPQFTSNRMVYWVFSENVSGGNITSVAKGRLSNSETTIENPTVIYRANPSANVGNLHYGGRIVFDNTGNLFVSTGERSDLSTRPLAQSATAALGKILRITTSGQPAPGNPSFSQSGALPELYSIGHRNPQGIAIHPVTGELWQSEHGPRGGDEINRVLGGKNYGWPTITYGIEYSGATIGAGIQQQAGMEQPVYYWDPVISPSGITFYKGNTIPEWQNNLFVASLSGMNIARLVMENNKVIG